MSYLFNNKLYKYCINLFIIYQDIKDLLIRKERLLIMRLNDEFYPDIKLPSMTQH